MISQFLNFKIQNKATEFFVLDNILSYFILDLSKLTSQNSPESPVLYIQNVNLLLQENRKPLLPKLLDSAEGSYKVSSFNGNIVEIDLHSSSYLFLSEVMCWFHSGQYPDPTQKPAYFMEKRIKTQHQRRLTNHRKGLLFNL